MAVATEVTTLQTHTSMLPIRVKTGCTKVSNVKVIAFQIVVKIQVMMLVVMFHVVTTMFVQMKLMTSRKNSPIGTITVFQNQSTIDQTLATAHNSQY